MDTAEDWADARGFQRGFVDVGGVELHYVSAGKQDAQMVLLLHGFPEFWYAWRHLIDPLAEEFFVVAPDLRGYNHSDRPRRVADYRLDRLRSDLYELVQRFGRGSTHLVGHDWGGMLALSFARHHPAHVDRQVVANTFDPERPATQLRGTQLLRSWYAAFFQLPRLPETMLRVGNYRLLRAAFDETATRGAFTEIDLQRYRAAWERPGAITAGLNYYRALGRTVLKRSAVFPATDRIYVPTRILWGDEDTTLRPKVADAIAAGIDDPQLRRYPEATHWIHLEYPERFAADTREFLVAE